MIGMWATAHQHNAWHAARCMHLLGSGAAAIGAAAVVAIAIAAAAFDDEVRLLRPASRRDLRIISHRAFVMGLSCVSSLLV